MATNVSPKTSRGPFLWANGLHALSCIRCAQRKVKCDRVDPCSNCVKHSVICEYRQGAPYKRKKRSHPEPSPVDLQRRLEKYEEALRSLGVDPTTLKGTAESGNGDAPLKPGSPMASVRVESRNKSRDHDSIDRDPQLSPPDGRLIVQDGKSRYLEGNSWNKVGEMSRSALLPDSDDEEDGDEVTNDLGLSLHTFNLMLGDSPHLTELYDLYPTAWQFDKLWQAYVENVHPITMVIHAPSTRKSLLKVVQSQENASKDLDALLFATMGMAVVSLNEDDCIKLLGERKPAVLAKYRRGARQALSNAKFLLSSSFAILQAFTIYLFSIRSEIDPRVFWNLSGVALRNGQRLGLHKQLKNSELTPFEVEMRRRLWSQINGLDFISAQYAGCASTLSTEITSADWPLPLNVNEDDLDPEMAQLPPNRKGATDIIFCQLGHKIFMLTTRHLAGKAPMEEGYWNRLGGEISLNEKDKLIDEIEREIELDVLSYCDFLQPVHFLVTSIARLIICKIRFAAHHPRRFQHSGYDVPQVELEFLFQTALRVIEYDNALHEQPILKRFLWHSHQNFQWSSLIHVLSELKIRTQGREADRAWEQVRIAYQHRPEIASAKRVKPPLYAAVNCVALEAWACREKAFEVHPDEQPLVTPDFIIKLREQKHTAVQTRNIFKQAPASSSHYTGEQIPHHQYPTPDSHAATMDDFTANPQPDAPTAHSDYTCGAQPSLIEPLDWDLFDSLINEDMIQGFGNAMVGETNYWNALGGG